MFFTSYCMFFTSYCMILLLIACSLLLFACSSLLIACSLLLIACSSLLIACSLLLIACSSLRPVAPSHLVFQPAVLAAHFVYLHIFKQYVPLSHIICSFHRYRSHIQFNLLNSENSLCFQFFREGWVVSMLSLEYESFVKPHLPYHIMFKGHIDVIMA